MKKYNGKSNIDILKDYVAGVRPFIQVGFVGDAKKHRSNGEKWTDTKGIEWERKDGKNVRLTKTQGEFIRELIAQKCKCGQDIKWGTNSDRKLFNRTGLCTNCLIDYETKLRILGIYPHYELYKLSSYELGILNDIKTKLLDVIKFFTNDSGDVEVICNSEGFIERWRTTNKDEILDSARKDLKMAEDKISEISKIKNTEKKKYLSLAKKNKLESYV